MKRRMTRKGIWTQLALVLASMLVGASCDNGTVCDPGDDFGPAPVYYPSYALAANTDFGTGGGALIQMDAAQNFPVLDTVALDVDPGGMDLAWFSDRPLVFLAGRQSDSVYVLDPLAGMAVLGVFPVGPGGWTENPQDVLVIAEDKAYVSRFGSDDLLIIDPRDGTVGGSITFTGIPTNADGLARPADMVLVRGRVFVALQNLDADFNFGAATVENGIIAVIDPNTDAIVTTVTLERANPQRLIYSPERDQFLAAGAGLYWDAGGNPLTTRSGLEVMAAKPPYRHHVVVSGENAAVDGNIYDVATFGARSAYILTADGFANADCALLVDLGLATVDPYFRYPALATANDDLAGIAVTPDGYLVIGDRVNSGLAVTDLYSYLPAGFISLPLPPSSLITFGF